MNSNVRTRQKNQYQKQCHRTSRQAANRSASFFVTQITRPSAHEWFQQFALEPFDWHLPCFSQSIAPDWMMNGQSEGSGHDDSHVEEQHDSDVATATPTPEKPPFYVVVLFNDDYTPMEFVIEVLQQYFGLDLDRATEVMLSVHYQGKGAAGLYPRDIAETKAQQVNRYARSMGHPLLCQIEPQAV